MAEVAAKTVAKWRTERSAFMPGYRHRWFYRSVDPRTPCLLDLVDEAARAGTVSGRYAKSAVRCRTPPRLEAVDRFP